MYTCVFVPYIPKTVHRFTVFVNCPHLVQAAATGTLSTAERSYPTSAVRGRSREDPMRERRQPRGATPRPRSGAAAGRSYPTFKEWWLCGCRRAKRSYSTFKVRRGGQ